MYVLVIVGPLLREVCYHIGSLAMFGQHPALQVYYHIIRDDVTSSMSTKKLNSLSLGEGVKMPHQSFLTDIDLAEKLPIFYWNLTEYLRPLYCMTFSRPVLSYPPHTHTHTHRANMSVFNYAIIFVAACSKAEGLHLEIFISFSLCCRKVSLSRT